jgi:DNA-binding MarR family transcriptional regulator
MKNIIEGLNKAFESRVRLGIMSILMVEEGIDYNSLKETLDVTDGNLASHASALEKLHYIAISKSFVGKKTRTVYAATAEGRNAFSSHLAYLEKLLKPHT